MKITPDLVEQLISVASQFTSGAAWVMPEQIAALAEEFGNDGTFEVRCSLGVSPCVHLDHRAPDGALTELFSVKAMTGNQIEAEKKSLH